LVVAGAEAAAFARIFGVSLDSLLGRNVSLENDLTYAVHSLQEVARQAADQIKAIIGLLAARGDDVTAFEFDDRDELLTAVSEAAKSLLSADFAFARVRRFDLPADLNVTFAEKRGSELLAETLAREAPTYDPDDIA
jgi:hypothetical protein